MKKIIYTLLILLLLAVTYMYITTSLFISFVQKTDKDKLVEKSDDSRINIGDFDYPGYSIKDESGLFSLTLPASWDVVIKSPKDFYISSFFAKNKYLDAELSVIVSETKKNRDLKIESKTVFIDGIESEYNVLNAPGFSNKRIIFVDFEYEKKAYSISFKYDEKKYSDGEHVFRSILDSFDLLNLKDLANVKSIDIVILESFPVQVNVIVRGEHPNACVELSDVTEHMDGNDFFVELHTETQDNNVGCIQVLTPFEKVVSLDAYGLGTGEYTVNVNGIKGAFKLEAENTLP